MPRISTKDSSETEKRAPRRQVVRKVVSTRVRKNSSTIDRVENNINETLARKAPTSVSEPKSNFRLSRKAVVFSGVFMAVLATAVWIGTSDSGQINVASKIEERNIQIANGEFTADNSSGTGGSQIVPVQNGVPNVPNGGLKGRGVGTASVNNQQASVVTASSTENATSTEATSTEAVNNSENTPETSTEDSSVSDTASVSATPEAGNENNGSEGN